MSAQQRSPEEIRASIERNRAELATSLERLRAEAAELADWRKHIANNQQSLVIGAAALGFLVGGGVSGFFGLFTR
jgi:hypothetical protein